MYHEQYHLSHKSNHHIRKKEKKKKKKKKKKKILHIMASQFGDSRWLFNVHNGAYKGMLDFISHLWLCGLKRFNGMKCSTMIQKSWV